MGPGTRVPTKDMERASVGWLRAMSSGNRFSWFGTSGFWLLLLGLWFLSGEEPWPKTSVWSNTWWLNAGWLDTVSWSCIHHPIKTNTTACGLENGIHHTSVIAVVWKERLRSGSRLEEICPAYMELITINVKEIAQMRSNYLLQSSKYSLRI
jgi:hypothetical protein